MAENEVVCENETNVDTSVTVEPLVVPAAVFTATLGCNWTRLPDFVTELDARNSKKLVVGLLQERGIELVPGRIVKGVLYRGEYAVAFSLQQVTGWDQAGRDADYYACAFIKDDLIGKIDFERLLQHDYFNCPVEEPKDKIDCTDMVCGEFSHTRCLSLFNAIHKEVFDWGALGMLLPYAKSAASRWLMVSMRTNSNANATCYADCEGWDEEVVSQVRNALSMPDRYEHEDEAPDAEGDADGGAEDSVSEESACVMMCPPEGDGDVDTSQEQNYSEQSDNDPKCGSVGRDGWVSDEEFMKKANECERLSSEVNGWRATVEELKRRVSTLSTLKDNLLNKVNMLEAEGRKGMEDKSKLEEKISARNLLCFAVGVIAFVLGVCITTMVVFASK